VYIAFDRNPPYLKISWIDFATENCHLILEHRRDFISTIWECQEMKDTI
jgi:hypothetical protein